VLTPHVEAHAGRFLRTDTPEVGGDYTRFIADCGLQVFDIVWSMGLQAPAFTPVAPDGIRRYGLASQALG
jgi:hypothetical protein